MVFEPEGTILAACPQCDSWIDADAESCECGWDVFDSLGLERAPEEYEDVQEP